MLSEVGSQDVPEVAGRNYDVHRLSGSDGTLFHHLAVSVDVIDHLRNQTADVDGVRRRELESCCVQTCRQVCVSEHVFDVRLCVIEVSVDGHNRGVVAFLCHHLFFLDGADAVLRIEHDDACVRHISESVKRRFSGVTRSRRQDHDFFRAAVLFGGSRHQVRQDRKGHVFEGDGRSVEQFQIVVSAGFH